MTKKKEETKKDACKKLFADKDNPATDSFKGLLTEIKRISGCEITLKYSKATMKNFSELKKEEKIATFFCKCRNGKCGVKSIQIVLYSSKAEIKFQPESPTDDVEFDVDHQPVPGAKPR